MISITVKAKEKIDDMLKEKDSSSTGIRLKLAGGESLEISLADLNKLSPEEEPLRDKRTHFFVELDGFLFIVDKEGQEKLTEGTLDFEEGGVLSGNFKWTPKPEAPEKDESNPMVAKIQELLDREINPSLAMHGGRAELLNVLDNKVYMRFGGGCRGCSMIDMTVKQGIEIRIRELFPEITGVVDETDHAGGTNPYFRY